MTSCSDFYRPHKAKLAVQESYKTTTMPIRDLEQSVQSPLTDFAAQQKQKQQGDNYHSSSLGTMINPSSVNKTSLHPGGVEYVHTAIPDMKKQSLLIYCPT